MSKLPYKRRYLNNLVDKNFQNIFFPINCAMSMLLLPHFNLRDGFVTPNNFRQKLKALTWVIGILMVCYYRFKTSPVLREETSSTSFLIFTVYFDWLYYSFTFICLFISNIINTDNYVIIVLNLQKAFRNFNSIEETVNRLIFWNWVSMIVIPGYFLAMFVPLGDFSIAALLNLFPLVYFDVIVVYTSRVMRLIESELKMWLDEMQWCCRRIVALECNENEKELRMFQTYRNILNAFDLFKKICKVPILFEIAEIIIHVLIYLQVNINAKIQTGESLDSFLTQYVKMVLMFWVLKNCFLLYIVCDSCANFYAHVTKAEEICNEALMFEVTDDFRQLCKNVRRYNRVRFTRVRVCGATVDARLPWQIVKIVTAYVVVILQFDFL